MRHMTLSESTQIRAKHAQINLRIYGPQAGSRAALHMAIELLPPPGSDPSWEHLQFRRRVVLLTSAPRSSGGQTNPNSSSVTTHYE